MKKTIPFLLSLSLGVCCLGSMSALAAEEGQTGNYPVTIENNGTTITYEAAPERVVVLSYTTAEVMAALGLEDKIVALAPSMNRIDEVMDEYKDVIAEIPVFDEAGMTNGVPSLETVLSVEPDFVYGSFFSFFPVNCGAAEDYINNGIGIYAADSTWEKEKSLENLYTEIENIGMIFGVEDRAAEIVEDMRAREQAVLDAVADVEKVPVFVFDYDNGDGTYLSTGSTAYASVLVEAAGGANVFADVEDSYATVASEEIISRNPQSVICISYYTEDDGQKKIDTMKESDDFKDVDAIINDSFLSLSGLAFGASAGMQSLDSLEAIAQFLHPEVF